MRKVKRSYTIEEFKKAVADSTSIRQTLLKLGLDGAGQNYRCFKKLVKEENINTSHFNGQGWSNGKTLGPKNSIEDYLSNKIAIGSFSLKNRLLKEGLLTRVCSNCGLTEWLGHPCPLDLHHIDSNPLNNNLSNLCLLCPNCHAQTHNFRGKAKRKK